MSNVYIHWCNSVFVFFCFVSVTVLKYYDQKQEFILAYNSKEGVHNAQKGMGAGTKARLANHISSAYGRAKVGVSSVMSL